MLYDLEPHIDISGDVWYSGQDIDAEFIEILSKQCYAYVYQKGYASVEEVTASIRKSGVSKVELKSQNIQSILDILVYDAKIETVPDPKGPAFLV